MKNFIVLFREPDGRTERHPEENIAKHQANWKAWFDKWSATGKLTGGSGLTMNGKLVKGRDKQILNCIHYNGTEIVGGFLLLKAENLEEAVSIAASCPIYEFDGYAEVREMQTNS